MPCLKSRFEEILKATDRATRLIRQLLTFSRRQVLESKVVNLNDILLDMDKMLRRLIGEDIELVTLPGDNLWRTKVDPGQIEQVIVDLVVNARDAMPKGCRLTLETANSTLWQEYVNQHGVDVPSGSYVMLAVSDTGIGMTEDIKARIFEPFFTTKGMGHGTGPGFSTCYGIIKQSGGYIWLYSGSGKGTTFKIYFPQVERVLESLPKREESGYMPRGTETILIVVEDDPEVRLVAAKLLSEQSYSVLQASNGEEVLQMVRESPNKSIFSFAMW